MFDSLRKSLIESFKHRSADGVSCISCGTTSGRFAFHVLEYMQDDGLAVPSNFVPMSRSRGVTRGSACLCERCCPPCRSCQLPMPSNWVTKMLIELKRRHPHIRFYPGNGICRDHIHPIHDFRMRRRKPVFHDPNANG